MRALFVLVAMTAGCGSTIAEYVRAEAPQVERFGNLRPDVRASELHIAAEHVGEDNVDAIKAEMWDAIVSASQSHSGPPQKARFRAEAKQSENMILMLVPCFVVLSLVGCPQSLNSASVDLELQVGDKIYRGRGEDTSVISFFYNGRNDGRDVGVGRALGKALRNLKPEGAQ